MYLAFWFAVCFDFDHLLCFVSYDLVRCEVWTVGVGWAVLFGFLGGGVGVLSGLGCG